MPDEQKPEDEVLEDPPKLYEVEEGDVADLSIADDDQIPDSEEEIDQNNMIDTNMQPEGDA